MELIPAFNEEAECAVIGSMILSPEETIPIAIAKGCSDDWFFNVNCKKAYKAITEMSMTNRFIDLISVTDHPVLKEAKLVEWLHTCCADITTTAHFEHYLGIVHEKYANRQTTALLVEHATKLSEGQTVEEVLTNLQFDMPKVENHIAAQEARGSDVIATSTMDQYELNTRTGHTGLPSRWFKLQHKSGGYKRRKNTIVAGRPGMGKSTFAHNEALHMALEGYDVGIIGMEMTAEESFVKMACDMAGIDSFKYNKGDFNSEELRRFKEAIDKISKLKIHILDSTRDIKHICNWVKKVNRRKNLDVVFYDYIQLMSSKGRTKRHEQISEYSKLLLDTADKCNFANVILSQISRGGEPPHNAKPDERWRYVPKLYNLKDSGSLEEDAYLCVILYAKPDEDMSDEDLPIMPFVFDVAKHRGGRTGKVYSVFNKPLNRFETGNEC